MSVQDTVPCDVCCGGCDPCQPTCFACPAGGNPANLLLAPYIQAYSSGDTLVQAAPLATAPPMAWNGVDRWTTGDVSGWVIDPTYHTFRVDLFGCDLAGLWPYTVHQCNDVLCDLAGTSVPCSGSLRFAPTPLISNVSFGPFNFGTFDVKIKCTPVQPGVPSPGYTCAILDPNGTVQPVANGPAIKSLLRVTFSPCPNGASLGFPAFGSAAGMNMVYDPCNKLWTGQTACVLGMFDNSDTGSLSGSYSLQVVNDTLVLTATLGFTFNGAGHSETIQAVIPSPNWHAGPPWNFGPFVITFNNSSPIPLCNYARNQGGVPYYDGTATVIQP